MRISAEKIRSLYPVPQKPRTEMCSGDVDYCVLGAGAKFFHNELLQDGEDSNSPENFPSREEATQLLMELNSRLTGPNALAYADYILYHNDWGDFEEAWELFDKALSFGYEEGDTE